ncbi:ATP-binding protein [Halobacteria archaeon AArc-curdl1]|uniref:histidine kinase n=1 Tax=Natronosalvus hydrolyticus TaxID=2979988 RepID=A0AAP2Z6U0_9EURY|nr:ATP-binding protein [Halobacteria archaeon AArc-curdl1]
MAWQHTIYAYPMLFAMALSLIFAWYALSIRHRHSRRPTLLIFAAMNVAIAIWTGFSALKLLSTDPTIQFHTYRLLYLGSSSVGPLLLLFVLAYTDRIQWVRRDVLAGLFVVPVVFWVLLFTNPHDVVIVDTRIVEVDGLLVMRATTGPAHVALSFTYASLMAVLTLAVIVSEAIRRGRAYLPQGGLLAVAIVTPITVSLLTSANVPPFTVDSVNYVPASTVISSVAIGIAMSRYRLLDLQLIADRTVIAQSPDAVLVLDASRRVVHANRTARAILGEQEVPLLDRPVDSLVPGLELSAFERAETTLKTTADGEETSILDVRAQPLERRGTHVGWVLVCRDVTELHRRQQELEAFTGVVSHDLRQPLRTTEQYLELVDERVGSRLDAEDRELIAVARTNANRMQVMIDDLLQYSKIRASEATFEPVDCNAAVDAVLDGMRFDLEDRNATVSVGDLPTVTGIDHLIRRLFQNLLENALKYGDVQQPEIEISATRTGEEWQFRVSDNGVGIDPVDQHRVFDLFTRGERANDRVSALAESSESPTSSHGISDSQNAEESGSGMGLAICKRIVETHGGAINLESSPGSGTTVSFTLPAVSTPVNRENTSEPGVRRE